MSDYTVKVVHREAVKAVGLKTRTSMAKAADDCPRLWQDDFGPRMPEVASFPDCSYGISVMVEDDIFDYWAAMPLRPGDPIPPNMTAIDLPDGQYAEVYLKSLNDLICAYQHLFSAWLPDSGYDLGNAPSYELYPADHLETGCLALYMPVQAKAT